jgi:predicted anti-sigma-YlaC factor YlaD
MAALARLDGEPADLTPAEIDAHAASCDACQAALASLTALHASLGREDYERLNVDLWPAIQQRLTPVSSHRAAEIRALAFLAAALVAWRLAQLLLDWPAPVVNSIVPLALVVVVLRKLTGDPFAIQSSSQLREQEGMS